MRYLFTTFFVCCIGIVNAQLNDSLAAQHNTWSFKTATKYWKFSPLDFISILPTFGTDIEVRLNHSNAIQAGVGIVPDFAQFITNRVLSDFGQMKGYRIRGELRHYSAVKTNRYLSAGISFRHLIIKDKFTIGKDPFTNQWGAEEFVYFQEVELASNRLNINLDLKYGFQKLKTEDYIMDFYAGLSVRSVIVRVNSELLGGVELPEQSGLWSISSSQNLIYPTPIVGFKIGFVQ